MLFNELVPDVPELPDVPEPVPPVIVMVTLPPPLFVSEAPLNIKLLTLLT